MTSKAVGIAVKAEKAVKEELKLELKSMEVDNRGGYYSIYVDPEYKKIYSWYKLAEEDSEPAAVQKGHDVCILTICEKDFKDPFDVDEEVGSALEKIVSRLKDLGTDIKDCEVIM